MRQRRGKAGDLTLFGEAAVEQLLETLNPEPFYRDDAHYMERALAQARRAAAIGEVPVGAVLVRNGSVLAEAHNLIETTPNATAHAEMLVLNEAARVAQSWRLEGVTVYVTLEPCPMCAGA